MDERIIARVTDFINSIAPQKTYFFLRYDVVMLVDNVIWVVFQTWI